MWRATKGGNKKPGNLIFNIEIMNNDAFTRNKDDLYSSIKIDFVFKAELIFILILG